MDNLTTEIATNNDQEKNVITLPIWIEAYIDVHETLIIQVTSTLKLINVLRKQVGWAIDTATDPFAVDLEHVEDHPLLVPISSLTPPEARKILLQTINMLIAILNETDLFVDNEEKGIYDHTKMMEAFIKYSRP